MLQATGYDGTITLEVFTPDRHYLAYSRDVLRQIWDGGDKHGSLDYGNRKQHSFST